MLCRTIALLVIAIPLSVTAGEDSALKGKCPNDDWPTHTSCVSQEVNASRERLDHTVATISKRMQPSEVAKFRQDQRRWANSSHRACQREADEDCPTSECEPIESPSKKKLELIRSGSMWPVVYGYCIDPKINERDIQLRRKYAIR